MSVHPSSTPDYTAGQGGGGRPPYQDEAPAGFGWVIFAGTMLMIVGILNIIYGIGAISDSTFFVNGAKYVFSDLNTWGWILLLTGVAQLLAAFGVWARNTLATWVGVAFASLNAIAQLLMIPAYPFLSLALFSIDMLVIYGLAVHGGHVEEA
jgi:uncharacterized membrane protein HdeD (DUF308 family)